MKGKQLIERNLTFDQKYIYIDITRGHLVDGQFTYCDNCGKLITNMIHVINKDTKKRHTIGTDCAETLATAKCLYNNDSNSDFYIDIYSYNKTSRFATELKKGKEYSFDGLFCHVETDKGKEIDCTMCDLEKFYPELVIK